jgi:AraC-like DNA-binding protein
LAASTIISNSCYMKILQTNISLLTNDFLHIDIRNDPTLASPYTQSYRHAHPELELVLVLEGFGKRVIGNKIETFQPGDMVFIGSQVPHLWLSDPCYYDEKSDLSSSVVVAYINPQVFQQLFNAVREFDRIKEMIKQAADGIRIFGRTREIIAEKLLTHTSKTGYERVEIFLQIMHLISTTGEKSFIAKSEHSKIDDFNSDRLVEVIKFVKDNLNEDITLKQVAGIAYMTEQSFCRYFKNRTRKNFFQYLEELRMSKAGELLMQSSELSIADIAYTCGYKSSSHFCRIFRIHYSQSPYQYRSGIHLKN